MRNGENILTVSSSLKADAFHERNKERVRNVKQNA